MKMQRKATVVGALMIAGGAIVTGASVTSQALAAEDTSADAPVSALVVGSASADGDAYQCAFDDLDLQAALPAPSEGMPVLDGVAVAGAGGSESAETGAVPVPATDGVEFSIAVGGDGSSAGGGGVMVEVTPGEQGTISVDESGAVVIGATDVLTDVDSGVVTPLEVREGTPEECDALLGDMSVTELPSTAPAP